MGGRRLYSAAMKLSAMAGSVGRYLRRHPDELVRAMSNACALRFGVPLDALRWVAAQFEGRGAEQLDLEAVPPGIRLAATIQLMGNRARAAAVVVVDEVRASGTELLMRIRLDDVSVTLLEAAPDSPVATLLKSGSLDLSRPGNLVAHMPRRPAFVVDARDDYVQIDLLRMAWGQDPRLRRALGFVTRVVTLNAIESDWEHLDVVLGRPRPT